MQKHKLGKGFSAPPVGITQSVTPISGNYNDIKTNVLKMLRKGDIRVGFDSTNTTYPASITIVPNSTLPETDRYFYHSDHLGSSSFISSNAGTTTQHLQYLPPDSYRDGESFVEQKSTTAYLSPYRYSGKEKDEETGYSYFGARYYNPELSVWLSVDPMAEKYPSTSAYMYCLGNPVVLVDPDGRSTVVPDDYFSLSGKYLGSDNSKTNNVRIINESTYKAINILSEKYKDKDPSGAIKINALHGNSTLWGDASTNESTDTKILNHYYTEAGYNLSELSSPVKIGGNPNNSVWATRLWDAVALFTFKNNYPVPNGYGIPESYMGITVDRGSIGTVLINKYDVINMFKHERGGHGGQYLNKKPFSERDATLFQVQDKSWDNVSPQWKNHMFKSYGNKLNKQEKQKYFGN